MGREMSESGLAVDSAEVREAFLRTVTPLALGRLAPDAMPAWGGFRPQEMVEHLLWSVELSTGRVESSCLVPHDQAERFRTSLYADSATPHGFMNPALVDGLPPLGHVGLDGARAALLRELETFLDGPFEVGLTRIHPIFGPLNRDEWHRSHYKHFHHHLSQFRLLGG